AATLRSFKIASSGSPENVLFSRGFERPTSANRSPTKSRPRRYPGQKHSERNDREAGSTHPSSPVPELSSHNRPPCHRGECGIDRPAHTTFPESTSRATPPSAR